MSQAPTSDGNCGGKGEAGGEQCICVGPRVVRKFERDPLGPCPGCDICDAGQDANAVEKRRTRQYRNGAEMSLLCSETSFLDFFSPDGRGNN